MLEGVWFPLVAVLVLETFVGLVLWAAWEPLRSELRENPWVNVPLFSVMFSVVLVPPLALAIGHAF